MRWWAVFVGALVGCAALPPPQGPVSVAPCSDDDCRSAHIVAGQAGGSSPSASAVVAASGCRELVVRGATMSGTSGMSFDVTTELVVIGRDEAAADRCATALSAAHEVDGNGADDAYEMCAHHDVGVVPVRRTMTAFAALEEAADVDECRVVSVAACALIGVVCRGFGWDRAYGLPSVDGWHVLELSLAEAGAPLTRASLAPP